MMNETEKDMPLRHDLARLDRLLAEIVREQEGEAVYHEMRTIPVEAHDRVGTPELSRRLAELSPAAAAALVRACGFYAQLTNLAEDLHHNRRRRAHRAVKGPTGAIDAQRQRIGAVAQHGPFGEGGAARLDQRGDGEQQQDQCQSQQRRGLQTHRCPLFRPDR